jgi:hypothetical protein
MSSNWTAKGGEIMTGINLRGLVVSKYGSAANMARSIGWSESKTRDITSGRRDASAADMGKLADALGISNAEDFVNIFFPEQSNSWTNST